MSVRSPNPEQKLAIEHNGGVLLSAGAGSGKTYVLVEHIVYLLRELVGKFPKSDIENELKRYLKSNVMMTFTKKAAGEMSTRLYKRIQEEAEQDIENGDFWNLVSKNLNNLYVGTIHGFCHKLISANFFPELKAQFDIIDQDSQKTKLESLYDEWFLETRIERDENMNKIVLIYRKQILSSIFEVFSSPDLRAYWSQSKIDELININLEETLEEIIEDEPWGYVLRERFDLSPYEESSTKAWYKNIDNFQKLISKQEWGSADYWNDIETYFASISQLGGTRGKNRIAEVDNYVADLKLFRDFFRSSFESIVTYIKNPDVFRSWVSEFHGLFKFIEERYEKLGGLTFSDLEYNVLRGLKQSPWAVKKIGEQYKYIIVDEFQDTSEVQYEILRKLVDDDFTKLFCVGDVKQAIYGFRGGELGVFKACSDVIPQNLDLSKNYRSENKIIQLNNTLFDYLFKKGINYKGEENSPVDVVYQEYPGEDKQSGEVCKIEVEVEHEKKLSSRDMDLIEAQFLFENILEKSKEEGTIGILYKNLGASGHLIPKLVESGLGFTAQVKIPMSEGPLWAIFSTILEAYLDPKDESEERACSLVQGILNWMGIDKDFGDTSFQVKKMYKDIPLLGFETSFELLIGNLGICDGDFEKNFSRISHLNELAGEDPEKLYSLLGKFGPEKVSVDFRYGEDSDKIFLMTAHGSKGLEFDHVFLGGIHTNGRKHADSPLLGKMPGSLKWKLSIEKKDFLKSPIYLLEQTRSKKKDFSESKRLFYVACTRAQKSLHYVDISQEGIGAKYSADSWINGMRLYEESSFKGNAFHEGHVTGLQRSLLFAGRETEDELSSPLFQKDNLGVYSKPFDSQPLGVLAEVSVTRLATLAQCPRKFYLGNICKLEEEDLEILNLTGGENKLFDEAKVLKEDNEADEVFTRNTRERGIHIHDAISRAIKGNLVVPLDVTGKDVETVRYVLDLLREKNTYAFLSEMPVKFSLFGQMISGTPDLILMPERINQEPEVWDFKTGTRKENSELAYWFQLYCYAIQTCHEKGLSKDDSIKVALVYVDERKTIEKILTRKEIENLLFKEWKNLGNFNQVNLDHCLSCPFGNLCHPEPDSVARP